MCLGPYKFLRVEKLETRIGGDGTDDDVSVRICSDSNDICCNKKLSHTFSDDWSRNSNETWRQNDFGDCAKTLFKVSKSHEKRDDFDDFFK